MKAAFLASIIHYDVFMKYNIQSCILYQVTGDTKHGNWLVHACSYRYCTLLVLKCSILIKGSRAVIFLLCFVYTGKTTGIFENQTLLSVHFPRLLVAVTMSVCLCRSRHMYPLTVKPDQVIYKNFPTFVCGIFS